MEDLSLAVGGAVVSMALGLTGRAVGICWEWFQRQKYTFETTEGDKRVRIPPIMVSRSISTADGSADGEDEQGYIATGLKHNRGPEWDRINQRSFQGVEFQTR